MKNGLGGSYSDGAHLITPSDALGPTLVQCDPEGWTVFQSRGQFNNGDNHFFRDWASYKIGFGTAGKLLRNITYMGYVVNNETSGLKSTYKI